MERESSGKAGPRTDGSQTDDCGSALLRFLSSNNSELETPQTKKNHIIMTKKLPKNNLVIGVIIYFLGQKSFYSQNEELCILE